MARLKGYEKQLEKQPDKQLSLTAPDSRSMKSVGKGSGMAGYNVQAAVEAQNYLIIAHQVTNIGTDRSQPYEMAQHARRAMGIEEISAVADRGYYSGAQLLDCERVGITTYVAKTMTSDKKKKACSTRTTLSTNPNMTATDVRLASTRLGTSKVSGTD